MRRRRGALWALGLAGAAYAWTNRRKVQQQINIFSSPTPPNQLPDYGNNASNQYSGTGQNVQKQGQTSNVQPGTNSGGTDV
ncbi:MAG: hypothetical protein H0X37_23280 [Herpetosiphonaceae bacterium]|nr:hypothetical protein [Herpetosiphonaceae bacterium]